MAIELKGKKVDGISVETYTNPINGESSRELIPIKSIPSRQKQTNISKEQFDENWNRIFNKNRAKGQ
jgi:hypothetical protein